MVERGEDGTLDDAWGAFDAVRPRLFGIAYRMLGSVTEAEDVVQDAWLRWQQTDRGRVRDPIGFLVTTTSRLALNAATSARARREWYPGPWLPEPVDTSADPVLRAERTESLELAVLLLLERLSPAERAVYVLREAFDYPFRRIGEVLGTSEANARQLGRRARTHLARERYGDGSGASRGAESAEPDLPKPVSRTDHGRLLRAFLAAAESGDLPQLEKLLATTAVSYADGGGIVRAAAVPVVGRDSVARYVVGLFRKFGRDLSLEIGESNGRAAILGSRAGTTVALVTIDASSAGIERVLMVLNPVKLGRFQR
ncbi:sigma-70 family RNA polymerase sigma factor [Rugosimonospora africana]|uniref:RNA polymerase sigma24 factor n=1 Tax=Rugosimonospora africana TaxID=556532 RepID=A0A8J3R4C3_9ACTN|nr:sigma-70 family RNA polymerase sigma factor [Rugosimonospora africana]GIH19821.1 RNA polymerase sigma24 factor [Rugosimonospora africana]